ncbi:hypothetical protein ACOMHN_033060 [Nucella lapillus]
MQIEVKDKNPFIVVSPEGEEKEIPATKLTINNVPLSFSDEEILRTVKKLGASVRSKLIDERDRDKDGQLTRWKTGRRFLYIDVPTKEPLPKSVEIGPFKAALYHKEQKTVKSDIECRKCFQKGHVNALCPNPIKCRQCFKEGHRAGDSVCSLAPDTRRSETDQNAEPSVPGTPSRWQESAETHEDVRSGSERGRPTKRQRHSVKTKSGQTVINFPRDSSRSASAKRPRSTGRVPPPTHRKRTLEDEGTPSEDDYEESNESFIT